MTWPVATVVVAILVAAAGVHLFWAMGGTAGKGAAIPSRDGRPVFSPTPLGTALVGLALLLIALLVAATAGELPAPLPARWPSVACAAVAIVFALRAIGDRRYVGFFKRVKNSRFAQLDSWVYSPLCLGLAAGIGGIAVSGWSR